MAGGGPALEAARREANSVRFSRPSNNLVSEDRLKKFIAVRATMFEVYEKYRPEIEAVAARAEAQAVEAADLRTALSFSKELHQAEIGALGREKMPEAEYAFIQQQLQLSISGLTDPEEVARAAKRAEEEVEKAEKMGLSRETVDTIRRGMQLSTPPENIALFKKYETYLQRYAMPLAATRFRGGAQPR